MPGQQEENKETMVVPPFDFTEPLRLTVIQRMDRVVQAVKLEQELTGDTGDDMEEFGHIPFVPPTGLTELELMEQQQWVEDIPAEYLEFLRHWRYLYIDDGRTIYGYGYGGVAVTDVPWVSQEHMKGHDCLVIGSCWQYADGDQLIVQLGQGNSEQPVLLYLHEDGPKIEEFAPSFSLALWRLVFERLE